MLSNEFATSCGEKEGRGEAVVSAAVTSQQYALGANRKQALTILSSSRILQEASASSLTMTATIYIVPIDYTNESHVKDFRQMMNSYSMDPRISGEPMDPEILRVLPERMLKFGMTTTFVLYADGQPAGLANCIIGFSTFAAKNLLNIHDFYIDTKDRGQGLSQKLLARVEAYAREQQCCKLTLEVLDKNATGDPTMIATIKANRRQSNTMTTWRMSLNRKLNLNRKMRMKRRSSYLMTPMNVQYLRTNGSGTVP